jgi:PEP-CTERM motif-containing protein
MKGFSTIAAVGILLVTSAASAREYSSSPPRPSPSSCKGLAAALSFFGDKHACGPTVSVPEPATLGLLGISLIGLAVKRRRK